VAPSGGASAFSGLTDVTITSPTSGQFARYNGLKWNNYTLGSQAAYMSAGIILYAEYNVGTSSVVSTFGSNVGSVGIKYEYWGLYFCLKNGVGNTVIPNTANEFRIQFPASRWGFGTLGYFGALPNIVGQALGVTSGGAYRVYNIIAMESTNNTARLVDSAGTILTCSAARALNFSQFVVAGNYWSPSNEV
jgi:hypothetical protein